MSGESSSSKIYYDKKQDDRDYVREMNAIGIFFKGGLNMAVNVNHLQIFLGTSSPVASLAANIPFRNLYISKTAKTGDF